MSSVDKKIMEQLAMKVGIDSQNVLRKASEFMRLLQVRMSGGSSIGNLSDPCRILLCLNLACNVLSVPFDKDDLTRLAGINRKQYSNALHMFEKLLNLSAPATVNSLCVQLGVSEIAALAQKVLNKFVELQNSGGKRPPDLSFPMYHCVAVFLACKQHKLKVDKSALVDAARIKRTQFDKLAEDFGPTLKTVQPLEAHKKATKRSHKLIELVEKHMEESEMNQSKVQPSQSCGGTRDDEDFETWKRRILNEGSEEL